MKVVIFNAADKEYAVNIEKVHEVIRWKEPVPIPEAPDFVEGVINLRGKVITLINLRKKLKLGMSEKDVASRVLIMEIDNHFMGIVVDNVADVVLIEDVDISPPEEVLKRAKYLVGVGKYRKRLIPVMDMEKLLTGRDKKSIKTVGKMVEIRKRD